MTAAVEIDRMTKSYGRGLPAVVDDLSLVVAPGEVVALLGPSGSGKTTLLRLVAGFAVPDSGVVRLAGSVVAGPGTLVPPEQRGVGMVFQDYALFPHLDVRRNIVFGLTGMGTREREQKVRESLALVGLRGLEDRYPHQLSGGQQQRVALARALAPEPVVVLLDEPFSGLDAGMRAKVRDDVASILNASGASALFVTHDQDEALFMGDRVAVLNGGHLEQIGTADQVYHRPVNRFVAEFMGTTDFLPGMITADGILTELGLLAQRVGLPEGATVTVAFRPDDVRLAPDPSSPARVTLRHFEGTVALYHVTMPSGHSVHSLQSHTLMVPPGTEVRVWVDAGHDLPCFDHEGRAVTQTALPRTAGSVMQPDHQHP
ncbi:MAG TPA: ABC transporter ATP-binding protein [Thermoleophilia bacterium]|nr:ABC transporter ATP-binding protein [Thermoleophilia bacterium]